jgi:hypothetical protein
MSTQCPVPRDPGPAGTSPGVYQRRRPERTVPYQAVQEHLETWLARQRETDPEGDPIPVYVERDLRRYLECGILAYGFARAYCEECGHDFLIAFSCKGRGICPSCNTRRMAETAAHLVDHVIPPVPVRQWVLSLPKRLRWHLHRDPALTTAVLRLFLRAVERTLLTHTKTAPAGARMGAVSFIHRFGAALNPHTHYHCCVTDGMFSGDASGVCFHTSALNPADIQKVQETVRQRTLRLFQRRGLLTHDEVEAMLDWSHGGGFSIDASVRIVADDRRGLERLLRYCARPLFAQERLAWAGEHHDRLVYRLPKPMPDGRAILYLTPLELLDRLALLIPPPRRHRHRYHGVFAPNAPLRAQVTALLESPADAPPTTDDPDPAEPSTRPPHAYLWAMLIARIYDTLPLACPVCGATMRIIALITEVAPIQNILDHLGEPHEPPPLHPPRGPPDWIDADEQVFLDEDLDQDRYEIEFDQRVTW